MRILRGVVVAVLTYVLAACSGGSDRRVNNEGVGTGAGVLLGGVVGSQFGRGSGKVLGTVVGAVFSKKRASNDDY